MFSKKVHRYLYIFSLILLGVSIPFSVFLMSVSQFLLATNWLLELDFVNKWERIKKNKPALFLIGLFLLHLLWMINSTNQEYGWHDIRIKLPLFVLALLIGSSKQLNFSELKIILHFFICSILSSSLFSALIYYGIIEREITDVRQISIFISHIRLSLLVNLGIFFVYYFGKRTNKISYRLLYLLAGMWFVFFLFILNAYTGLLVFLAVFAVLLLRSILLSKKPWIKYTLISAISVFFIGGMILSINFYQRFYDFDDYVEIEKLDRLTVNGKKYLHMKNKHVENGHYVYHYISTEELETEWNMRSNIEYQEGLNAKGNKVRLTLIHYLTSLNYRKDSVGISKLTEEDIATIEAGYSNYIYKNKYSLYAKVYPILKQFHSYMETGYAEGASVVQRFEYLKIAKRIINENFWFGTGTGDVDDAYRTHYAKGESSLSEEYQHRAHNQYITFFISFGFFGFVLSLFFMIAPVVTNWRYFLPVVFMLTAFLSMLNEDTLETQAGITFFTYFYILFLGAFSFSNYYKQKSTD